MNTFRQFLVNETVLLEDDQHLKTHLSHIEDLAIERGKEGFKIYAQHMDEINRKLKGFEANQEINAKIDGSPMILFGLDPRKKYKNKFFISLKGGLSQVNPKIMHDAKEVDALYSEPALRDKLKNLLKHLEAVYDDSGKIYQADTLFATSQEKQTITIGSEKFIAFKPNVVVYAVPVDPKSDISNRIMRAKIGIIIHESFKGIPTNQDNAIQLQSMGRNVQEQVEKSKNTDVFIESSNYRHLSVNLPDQALKKIHSDIAKASLVISEISDEFNQQYLSNPLVGLLKIYLNKQVDLAPGGIFGAAARGEEFLYDRFIAGLKEFIAERYFKEKEDKKTPKGKAMIESRLNSILTFVEQYKEDLKNLLMGTYYMTAAKYHLLRALSTMESKIGRTFIQNPDGSFTPTKDEGFVLFLGTNHAKLVDRLEFTKINRATGGKKRTALTV